MYKLQYNVADGESIEGRPKNLNKRGSTKVNLTGGNRSGLTGYRSGPVPVSAGTQPAKIQILNLNSKKEKFLKNF